MAKCQPFSSSLNLKKQRKYFFDITNFLVKIFTLNFNVILIYPNLTKSIKNSSNTQGSMAFLWLLPMMSTTLQRKMRMHRKSCFVSKHNGPYLKKIGP